MLSLLFQIHKVYSLPHNNGLSILMKNEYKKKKKKKKKNQLWLTMFLFYRKLNQDNLISITLQLFIQSLLKEYSFKSLLDNLRNICQVFVLYNLRGIFFKIKNKKVN